MGYRSKKPTWWKDANVKIEMKKKYINKRYKQQMLSLVSNQMRVNVTAMNLSLRDWCLEHSFDSFKNTVSFCFYFLFFICCHAVWTVYFSFSFSFKLMDQNQMRIKCNSCHSFFPYHSYMATTCILFDKNVPTRNNKIPRNHLISSRFGNISINRQLNIGK